MLLKQITQERFLKDMISRVRSTCKDDAAQNGTELKYIAMIVDPETVKYVSACCKVYDILEEGVTIVEDLFKRRQPLTCLDAVYYLQPSRDSISELCSDFKNEKSPQYKNAHVFFSRPLGDQRDTLYQLMSQTPGLLSRLKTLVEFNLAYIARERRVFHFKQPLSLQTYFPTCDPKMYDQITDELLTLCVSLGDCPDIRYHANENRMNEQIALSLHHKLLKLPIPGLSRGLTTLLILDRSIDIAPLFLHEYTYQAYIYDILDIPVCSTSESEKIRRTTTSSDDLVRIDDSVEYEYSVSRNKVERRVALLDDTDTLYLQYRHEHLMNASKEISQEIKKFFEENATAKFSEQHDMTYEEMQKTIRDLPKYQELLSKYSVHHYLIQLCFTEFNRLNLQKIGFLEQDLATGVDAFGKEVSVKKCLASFGALVASSEIGNEEKTRLLLLYFSMIQGVKDIDRRKMIEAAQLPLETMHTIEKYAKLNLENESAGSQANTSGHTHKFHSDKKRISSNSQRAKATDIPLSRFQPYLKDIMEKAAQGTLHAGKFPYVADPTEKRSNADVNKANVANVRARNKDWDFGFISDRDKFPENSATQTSQQNKSANTDARKMLLFDNDKKVIIMFVVGGVTLSETRCAYEVSRSLGCEILIGGSTIITPKKFLASLKKLK